MPAEQLRLWAQLLVPRSPTAMIRRGMVCIWRSRYARQLDGYYVSTRYEHAVVCGAKWTQLLLLAVAFAEHSFMPHLVLWAFH